MLFNSGTFLFAFLPLAMLGFALAFRWRGLEAAWTWLAAASVFFYGWWNPVHVPLLLASVTLNYLLARRLSLLGSQSSHWLLVAGVVINLGLLGWFKYWHFFASNVAACFGQEWHGQPLELPLGISFFTFHQLTYLLHCRADRDQNTSFRHYLLYVTFFPQLIAGPIVRPHEMLPQLQQPRKRVFPWSDLSVGFTLLSFGLFKKMVVADSVAVWVAPVFDHVYDVGHVAMLDAWVAVMAYTLQLYFDFSGYSDMALGLARMFGVDLPANFFSPYKACSIVDFWRRWHITLSSFLRDYLYIPLGGSRKGPVRRSVNLLLVMFIGGLWHGAGWTFALWGLWHGGCLLINHLSTQVGLMQHLPRLTGKVLSWSLTFLAVILGWTLFRAPDLASAVSIAQSLFGYNGIQLPPGWLEKLPLLAQVGITAHSDWQIFAGPAQLLTLAALLMAAVALPNTLQITRAVFTPPNQPGLPDEKTACLWQPTARWAILTGAALTISLLHLGRISEFLYFQF